MSMKKKHNILPISSLFLSSTFSKNNNRKEIGMDIKSNEDDSNINPNFNSHGVDYVNINTDNNSNSKDKRKPFNFLEKKLNNKFVIMNMDNEGSNSEYIQHQMNKAKELNKDILVFGCGLPDSDINTRLIKTLSKNDLKATIIFEDIDKFVNQKETESTGSWGKKAVGKAEYPYFTSPRLYNAPIKATGKKNDNKTSDNKPIGKNKPQMMVKSKKRKKKAKNGRRNKK